jgi:hypothetical protein
MDTTLTLRSMFYLYVLLYNFHEPTGPLDLEPTVGFRPPPTSKGARRQVGQRVCGPMISSIALPRLSDKKTSTSPRSLELTASPNAANFIIPTQVWPSMCRLLDLHSSKTEPCRSAPSRTAGGRHWLPGRCTSPCRALTKDVPSLLSRPPCPAPPSHHGEAPPSPLVSL